MPQGEFDLKMIDRKEENKLAGPRKIIMSDQVFAEKSHDSRVRRSILLSCKS